MSGHSVVWVERVCGSPGVDQQTSRVCGERQEPRTAKTRQGGSRAGTSEMQVVRSCGGEDDGAGQVQTDPQSWRHAQARVCRGGKGAVCGLS